MKRRCFAWRPNSKRLNRGRIAGRPSDKEHNTLCALMEISLALQPDSEAAAKHAAVPAAKRPNGAEVAQLRVRSQQGSRDVPPSLKLEFLGPLQRMTSAPQHEVDVCGHAHTRIAAGMNRTQLKFFRRHPFSSRFAFAT